MSERVYIETYGCQMNVADSELMAGLLAGEGYVTVDSADEADVVLLNTCAIREKAEDRIIGRLGWLKSAKDARPSMIIGVTGCMAGHIKQELQRRAPYVDLVLGPDAYRRLPQLLREVRAVDKRDPLLDVRLDRDELYEGVLPRRAPGISGFVTIMRGCDKFCTFCIVPYVRGRERSVPPDEVLRQVEAMQRRGFREVTLLGQTVSSYRVDDCDFATLLRRIHESTDLRIRFTSPYPTDFDEPLLQTLAELPRVGRHLHLPLQSGSSRVLADMKRQYTAEQFYELIDRVRVTLPRFALSTDIIVGYPGETDADFEQTLELSRAVRFDSAFMFKYSERSGTHAARKRPDDVPEPVKSERLQRLIKLQETNSRERNAEMIGKRVEVLVTGKNPRDEVSWMGRSSCFRPAVLDSGTRYAPGDLVEATVIGSSTHTIFAREASQPGSFQPEASRSGSLQPEASRSGSLQPEASRSEVEVSAGS
jgi:tRNA-2-methylthio-N6-dimethylallyladenosine synthase